MRRSNPGRSRQRSCGDDDDDRHGLTTREFVGAATMATAGLAGCLDGGSEPTATERPAATPTATADRDRSTTAAGTPPASPQWGEITYPILGNADPTAGTLLVHFRIEAADLDAEPGPWYFPEDRWYRFFVADLAFNDANDVALVWRRSEGRGWLHATTNDIPGETSPMPGAGVTDDWSGFEDHWVAFTWKADGTISFWLDGQLASRQTVGGYSGLGTMTEAGRLTLGSRQSPITLYDVHVMDRALDHEQLESTGDVSSRFEQRPSSLLLDRFGDDDVVPDGERQTDPQTISGLSGESGGTPTAPCRFVDTPTRRGLRVFTPPAGADLN